MTPQERFTKKLLATMAEHQAKHDEDIREMREIQKATGIAFLRLIRIQETLAEAQRVTDEKLGALMDIVDRHLRGPDEEPA